MAAAVIAALLAPARPAWADTAQPSPWLPGRIIVRFRTGSPALRTLQTASGRVSFSGRPVSLFMIGRRITDLSPAAERLSRTARIEVDRGSDVLKAASEWAGRPDVEYAGPVHLIPVQSGGTPSDPQLASQWHHDAIGSRAAWQVTTGDPNTVIGIIDTGVDYTQADLKDNLWTNAAEANGVPGVDDDANGYVDDVIGYDFTDVPEVDGSGDFTVRDPDPMDEVGHGTWVAGVACATGNNGIGGAGVAFGARFMPLRAGFRPRNGFSLGFLAEDDAAAAVVYGVENGADVLNLSFGDQLRAPILEDAVRFAIDRGVIVVAASGNSGDDTPFYPAGISGVIAAGASDRTGARAGYSTWGASVDLLAPGSGILTTDIGAGYTARSGTSLAAPVVSGAAALLRSLHPDWSAAQISGVLIASARPAGSDADAHGARLLDIGAAVRDRGEASILVSGLDAGSAFDSAIVVRGTVQGAGVRGWQVMASKLPGGPWIRLGAEPRGTAVNETLVDWNVSDLPEGPMILRVDALGWNGPILSREVEVSIDHSPPLITGIEIVPVRSGPSVGIRLTARADEPVLGDLKVSGPQGAYEFRSVLATTDLVLGLDGPLSSPGGGPVQVVASFVNAAGLETSRAFTFQLPEASQTTDLRSHPAPGVRSWLPAIVDFDRDGRPDLLGELPAERGATYGHAVIYSTTAPACDTCGWSFTAGWESEASYLPRDAADFDGNGVPDVLGLELQQVRVYTRSSGSAFPDSLGWSTGEAWPARFIPAPDGIGSDIVAARDTGIRIYRRNGSGLALRQTIENPTTGQNSISPAIVVVHGSSGLSLATIDGDMDLIVVTRGSDGLFHPQWSLRLDEGYSGEMAAADLDGDGIDELITVEAVGVMPSPAAGLRDGFYRLHVFRDTEDQSYSPVPEMSVAVAGQFPGNPISVDAHDLDGDGRAELWWGVDDHLYLIDWPHGRPEFRGAWEGVRPGRTAFGNLAGGGSPSRNVVVFPGDVSVTSGTGTLFELSSGPAVPIALRLRVDDARPDAGNVGLTVRWNDASPPYRIGRRRAGASGFDYQVSGLTRSDFRDSTLLPGLSYVYTVQSEAGGPAGSITVTANLGNRIRSADSFPEGMQIEWEFPVQATESASVRLDGLTISSAGLDRTGRRLLIRTAAPMTPGTHLLAVTGYVSDPAYSLGPADTSAVIEFAAPVRPLTLRSVEVIEGNRLRIDFDPGAPIESNPEDFSFDPEMRVVESRRTGPATVELVLDPKAPLKAMTYQLRVAPGLREIGGSVVQAGAGNAMSFSVSPVVFPNPVRPEQRHVRFDWLGLGTRVTIFDMGGRFVWSGVAVDPGTLMWNLDDQSGRPVSPGVYLYKTEGVVSSSGKLAVIK